MPILLVLLLFAASLEAQVPPAGPRVLGTRGMVASAEPLATAAGVEILEAGGRAVDAAVAVAFALAVTWPEAGNLGGGGFLVAHIPERGEVAVDFREVAPRSAHRDLYRAPDGSVEVQASRTGHRAVAVPGSVAGLCHVLERYGTLPLRRVLAPALRLAGEGFVVSEALSRSVGSSRELLDRFPESRRVFLPAGRPLQAGTLFVQPELAKVLARIAEHGARGFHEGPVADLLVAEMRRGGGLITGADLAGYEVKERDVLRGSYRGFEVITMPPPSSGGVALLTMLNILEAEDPANLVRGTETRFHLVLEAMRCAFRDRALHLGDPDFARVPVRGLTSKAYARTLRAGIGERASPSDGMPGADPFVHEMPETTHLSVLDRWGGAVACTTTLNGSFGSGVLVPGAGFLLNNEMDDFAIAPGVPNMFGLVQGEANTVAPGRRPLSSMTPTLLLRNGRVRLVAGSPGGPTIINTVLHVVMGVVDDGLSVTEAVAAPRFHHQWRPDEVVAEVGAFSAGMEQALVRRGHRFGRPRLLGDAQAISFDPASGRMEGVADPRRQGRAQGL